ncbi:efflux RND transporter periplasmic adaptor subunit [Nannocystis sp.]|uniref:efflux RND transporter periplasmic adaptor subunit n=1 Tax=Nannocystis sp. TaxID=1962667 RepID=UPI0025DFF194|nr:efflux RND transporter periplasmic adaptor subunit [Nannocystis sp.]
MPVLLVIVVVCAALLCVRVVRCVRPGLPRAGALLLALAGAGCDARAARDGKADKDGEAAKEQPTPVVVGVVERGSIVSTISTASTIEAERQVTVHAESTGRLVDLTVEEGDQVKKGQLLARIRYDAQANSLVRANTSLEKARVDFDRAERLYNEKVIGQEEYLKARNALEVAQLDLSDRSREMRNTKVTAPFDGTITQRKVTEGAFVNNGAELLTIVDFDTLVARVFVPEKQLDRIQVGQAPRLSARRPAGAAARARSCASRRRSTRARAR